MVQKGIFQNISFIKIIGLILLLIPLNVRAYTIPNEYQEVEYIEGSGSQCIDSEFTPNGSIKIKITYEVTQVQGSNWNSIIGSARNVNATTTKRIGYYGDGYGSYKVYSINMGSSSNINWNTGYSDRNIKTTLEYDNGNITKTNENGTLTTTVTNGDESNSWSMYILAQNNGDGSCQATIKGKIYYIKLEKEENGETITSEYIPVYKKSDDTIGLYDTRQQKLLTNIGSGSFTKGEDVTPPTTPTPTPEDNPINDFLTIYIDRIQYLAIGFYENKYLFSMVVIIFWFVVLELTLRIIHIRGGYKK